MTQTSTDMHAALKRDTDAAHARVDAAFSRFELARADDREAFLRAQSAGLAAALLALRAEPDWKEVVRARIRATGHSVPPTATLDHSVPLGVAPDPLGDPLGVAYVVAGSLHGTSVLRGHLLRAGVTPPPFFEGSDWKPMWADVLARLGAASPSRHPSLVASATATFDAFHAAALAQLSIPA